VAPNQNTKQGQTDAWEAQLANLANYKAKRGDCNVPRS
jgi:hypothetical protein